MEKHEKMNKERTAELRARFVQEYIKDLKASGAAYRAGVSEDMAICGQRGMEYLKDIDTMRDIVEAMDERAKRTEVAVDRVLKEIARIAFFDTRKLVRADGSCKNLDELDEDTGAVIANLEVLDYFEGFGEGRQQVGIIKKYKLWDKNTALTNAMKHLGMDKQTLHLVGAAGGPVEVSSTVKVEGLEERLSKALEKFNKPRLE